MQPPTETKAIRIRTELRPGDIGRITAMHGAIYAAEHGFNYVFEAYVAESLAEFGKQYDEARDRLWLAEQGGDLVGSIGLVSRPNREAQLRWLLVGERGRGHGLGQQLIDECIAFARSAGHRSIYLWTVHTLEPAARLYRRAGFRLTEEKPQIEIWGRSLAEQRYDLTL